MIVELTKTADHQLVIEKLNNNDLVQFFSFGQDNGNNQNYFLTNQMLVKLPSPFDKKRHLLAGFDIIGVNPYMPNWITVRIPKGQLDKSKVIFERLRKNKVIEAFEVEKIGAYSLHESTSTSCNLSNPLFINQWHLQNLGQNGGTIGVDIKACEAWQDNIGNHTITTAVIDDGIELNHPDLVGNLSNLSFNATTNSSPSVVYGRHGTACAGLVAAVDNDKGVVGVAPGSSLMSISINFNSQTDQMFANAFYFATNNGASVISNSWGGGSSSTIISDAISHALNNGRGGLGTVVVFSAGNNNSSVSLYPGNSDPAIINVGAIDKCGIRSGRIDIIPNSCDPWGANSDPASAYGSTLDIVAGGSSISTTDRTGSNGYSSGDYTSNFGGTSAACPIVAGVAALVLSSNPCLTRQMVHDIICRSGQKLPNYTFNFNSNRPARLGTWNNEVGHGLVDAKKALVYATNMFLQNKQETGSIAHYYNRIFAGEFVNPDEPFGEYLITNSANVEIKAKNSIHLKSGFRAQHGSNFRGRIDVNNCDLTNPFARMASNSTSSTNDINTTELSASQVYSGLGNFSLFPNPATTNLILDFPGGFYSSLMVEIVDLVGKVHISKTYSLEYPETQIALDIHSLIPSVYILHFKTDKGIISKKFIKIR